MLTCALKAHIKNTNLIIFSCNLCILPTANIVFVWTHKYEIYILINRLVSSTQDVPKLTAKLYKTRKQHK
jgi:hypothetical protein